MIHIADKMREVLPILKQGLAGTRLPDLRPEVEDAWDENYAILVGLHYTAGDFDDQDYFDHDRFRDDFHDLVVKHFPDCEVRLLWGSQEVEVCR